MNRRGMLLALGVSLSEVDSDLKGELQEQAFIGPGNDLEVVGCDVTWRRNYVDVTTMCSTGPMFFQGFVTGEVRLMVKIHANDVRGLIGYSLPINWTLSGTSISGMITVDSATATSLPIDEDGRWIYQLEGRLTKDLVITQEMTNPVEVVPMARRGMKV